MSGDPEQHYLLAYGIVEEIITALSRMRWLFVIARNSSFCLQGSRRGRQAGWEGVGGSLCPRRQRSQGGEYGGIGPAARDFSLLPTSTSTDPRPPFTGVPFLVGRARGLEVLQR